MSQAKVKAEFVLGSGSRSDTLIANLDPRARLCSAFVLAISIVLLEQLWLLCLTLVAVLMLACVARIPFKGSAKKVLAMDLFMLYLILLLPFTVPGDRFITMWGFAGSWQGLEQGIRIALKANSVVLLMLTLVSSLSASAFAQGLAALRVSAKLIQLVLFTLRYLQVIDQEYHRLRRSMRARGFVMGFNVHSWRSVANLIAMLLLRSLQRSERVVAAMKCRGYQGQLHYHFSMHWCRTDTYYSFMVALFIIISWSLHVLQLSL